MARLVGAVGVPHTPAFPAVVAREGEEHEIARLFRAVRGHLQEMAPDILLIFTTDHLNTFFFDAWPIFAIGVADTFAGPSDRPPAMKDVVVRSDAAFAAHLRAEAVRSGFDVALASGISVDHSTMVPLHFLTPDHAIPIVPVFINGHLPPLPSSSRCLALGQVLRRAVESWRPSLRVAVIGSGSFSLEVHGPLMAPDLPYGVPNPAWAERVRACLAAGDVETVIAEATVEQLAASGNVAGEILNWVAMLGVVGGGRPESLVLQSQFGHAFGMWRVTP